MSWRRGWAVAGLLVTGFVCVGEGAPRHARHATRILRMQATAFSVDSKQTASGTTAREGIVASDPGVLPLGSRIRITGAGDYNGVYTVTETGSKVKGMHIDVYVPSAAAARRFGKRIVRVQVLEIGEGKQDAREKEGVASPGNRAVH